MRKSRRAPSKFEKDSKICNSMRCVCFGATYNSWALCEVYKSAERRSKLFYLLVYLFGNKRGDHGRHFARQRESRRCWSVSELGSGQNRVREKVLSTIPQDQNDNTFRAKILTNFSLVHGKLDEWNVAENCAKNGYSPFPCLRQVFCPTWDCQSKLGQAAGGYGILFESPQPPQFSWTHGRIVLTKLRQRRRFCHLKKIKDAGIDYDGLARSAPFSSCFGAGRFSPPLRTFTHQTNFAQM